MRKNPQLRQKNRAHTLHLIQDVTLTKIKRTATLEREATGGDNVYNLETSVFKKFEGARDDTILKKAVNVQRSNLMDWLNTSKRRILQTSVRRQFERFVQKEFRMSHGERLARNRYQNL